MMNSPLDPVATARLAEAGKVFTSDLTVDEFVLLETAGFEPLGLVMGTSVYHIGWQPQRRQQSEELGVLTGAMYTARENAMSRMQAEADSLQADGIVGVRLQWRRHGASPEHIEFIAVGTAVRFVAQPGRFRRPDGHAFSSHLSGQDMYKLARTGYAPVAFVLGNCVYHVAAQGFVQTLGQMGRNIEMPQWTQAYYDAREIAMSRMQAEAERDRATGVVGVTFEASEWIWGEHTMEFYVSGTAVRRVGEPNPVTPDPVLGF
ncbi:heavy metal-binding domain-containing protein [Tsukamurella soli]|uniref:heavy metal-binding domain-containing protein n=1 Tax=Tsukamurella soli TaxID=644556 RepID=UPI0031ECCAA7